MVGKRNKFRVDSWSDFENPMMLSEVIVFQSQSMSKFWPFLSCFSSWLYFGHEVRSQPDGKFKDLPIPPKFTAPGCAKTMQFSKNTLKLAVLIFSIFRWKTHKRNVFLMKMEHLKVDWHYKSVSYRFRLYIPYI